MSREILFRARRLDNGEWVYGDLYHQKICGRISPTIHTTDYTGGCVIPETIGQYTGLIDKNGNKIFVGDIIKCNNMIEGYKYIGLVDWDKCNPSMCIRYKSKGRVIHVEYDFIHCGNMIIELLGNIHNNPELWKNANFHKTK